MTINTRLLRIGIAVSALVASTLCVAQTNDRELAAQKDVQVIKSLTNEWLDIAASGDVDGYMALMAEDFIWLGDTGGPGHVGHDAVRGFLEPFFESFNFSLENMHSEEVIISMDGSFAVFEYYGTAVIEAKEGGLTTKESRKYFDFWRKGADGKWKCSRHLFVPVG